MRERGRYLRVLRNTHNIFIFATSISTSGQDFPKNYQHTLATFHGRENRGGDALRNPILEVE